MKYYVTMTDKFMSGWGAAQDKTNKLIIECETWQQAEQIERAARRRPEMRRINIRTTKPRYGSRVVESWKAWGDLGTVWTGGSAMNTTPLEWQALWDAMDANPDAWIPTTEAMYWQMLEVLPPEKMIGRNFLVGEASHHNSAGEAVYSCFTQFGDTYKAKKMTVAQFMREHGHIPARELR